MKIVLDAPDAPTIEIHVHADGTASVHADSKHMGKCRWEKRDNKLVLYIPRDVITTRDDDNGMSFKFEL